MTIAQIKTFLLVCRCMSFTEAATELNLTQSAVSRQMSTLESELGIRIFDRKNNTFRLTGAGHKLRSGLERVMQELKQAVNEARKLDSGIEGELRLGMLSDQAFDDVVIGALQKLSKTGKVNVVIQRMNFRGLYQALTDGHIDAANTIIQSQYFFSDCRKLIYARENMCLAVRRDFAQGLEEPLDWDVFRRFSEEQLPILMPNLNNFVEAQQPMLDMNRTDQTKNVIDRDFDSIGPMTAAGLCGAIVNRSNILSRDPDIVLIGMDSHGAVGKGILWMRDNPNPVIPRFIAAVKAEMAAQDDSSANCETAPLP